MRHTTQTDLGECARPYWNSTRTQGRLHRPVGTIIMKPCPACGRALPEINRYCTHCGAGVASDAERTTTPATPGPTQKEQLNLTILYGMVTVLLVSLVMPPWETPPSQPAAFLGFHFILSPPRPEAIVSRMLLTIELTTTAIAGLYLSFLFRTKS